MGTPRIQALDVLNGGAPMHGMNARPPRPLSSTYKLAVIQYYPQSNLALKHATHGMPIAVITVLQITSMSQSPSLPPCTLIEPATPSWHTDQHPSPRTVQALSESIKRPCFARWLLRFLPPSVSLPISLSFPVHLPAYCFHAAVMYVRIFPPPSCTTDVLYLHVILIVSMHSSMPFIPPPYPPSRRCPCGVDVLLRLVVATNLRNAGRPYYSCEQCRDWFRWGDGMGSTPRTTPTTTPMIEQGPFQPGASPMGEAASQAEERCRYAKCSVTRVGRKCQRRMCRKHCRSAGGCTSNGHSVVPSSSTQSAELSARSGPSMSQIDPLLRPPHAPHALPQSGALAQSAEPFARSGPSMSQIDPLLRPPHAPHALPRSGALAQSAEPFARSGPSMSQIDPLLPVRPPHAPHALPRSGALAQSAEPFARSGPSMLQIDPLLHPPHAPSANNDFIRAPSPLAAASSQQPLSSTSSESSLASHRSSSPLVSSSSSSVFLSAPQVDKGPSPRQPLPRLAMADSSINPRYTSQLRPIFVDHIATVHERAEQKRRRDQEVLQDKKRIHERVIVFSFAQNDTDPVTADFQQGFTYPYFKLTHAVLVELELAPPDDEQPCRAVHYFDPTLDTWVKMKVDSVIELTKPSQKLFFKGTDVKSYPSFDRHLQAATTPASRREANLRVSLSQERNYVKRTRTIKNAHALDALDELLEFTSDEDQALAPNVHKRRMESNQPSPRSQRPRRQSSIHPADDDDIISLHDDDSITLDHQPTRQTTIARLVPGVDATAAKFPSSFYAVDIHTAFTFKSMAKLTLEAQFERFFKMPLKSSTFYDHKARWLSAPRDARDKAVSAGYTEAGQYSVFLAAHPAKDAEVKAARRKLRSAQPMTVT